MIDSKSLAQIMLVKVKVKKDAIFMIKYSRSNIFVHLKFPYTQGECVRMKTDRNTL